MTVAETESAYNRNNEIARASWRRVEEARLRDFIAAQPGMSDVRIVELDFPSSGSGISNGIGFLKLECDAGQGRELRDLVLRYAPGTTLLKQKSFAIEFATNLAAHDAGMPVARPLWLDADGAALGVPGFVMTRLYGESPAQGLYSKGIIAEASVEDRHEMLLQLAGFHGRLRRAAIPAAAVPHLLERGRGETSIARETAWLLEEARLNDPASPRLGDLAAMHDWLNAHAPPLRAATLVHGDPQPSNFMFRGRDLVAAVDWELSYLGHGEADLAILIFWTHLLKRFDKDIPGTPLPAEYVARYEQEAGAPAEQLSYFRVFAIYKVMCMSMCVEKTMPDFDTLWSAQLQALREARAEHEAAR